MIRAILNVLFGPPEDPYVRLARDEQTSARTPGCVDGNPHCIRADCGCDDLTPSDRFVTERAEVLRRRQDWRAK